MEVELDALQQRFDEIITTWPVPLTPSCKAALESIIDGASAEQGRDYFTSHPERLDEAESNFKTLLTEMTASAGRLGLTELHEETLREALAKLCPLFPICK